GMAQPGTVLGAPTDPTGSSIVESVPDQSTTSSALADQQLPVDTGPAQPPFPLEAAPAVTTPLISIPEGCPKPDRPLAVFDGKLIANSAQAARFEVLVMRAGSLQGRMQGNLVDIHYPQQQTRFLTVGDIYLVGVLPDLEQDFLTSKVRQPAEDFGGDAVIGLNDTDTPCPAIADGVRTVQRDGSEVDSGVLSLIKDSKFGLIRALLVPLTVAFGVLVLLVLIKHLLVATGRSLSALADDAD
ncbi:MAG TPA: hypothetical protein PKV27_01995, partial [Ilumatobacteraceae bacterium]|nr:hypothetical protein [Ilumatobacteraceae bacterium]